MLRSDRQLAHFGEEPWISLQARAFHADIVPASINPSAVIALCLEDVFGYETDYVDIPPSLDHFPNLAYLRLPKKYIPALRPGDIPNSVRVLEVIDPGSATFPANIRLPGVKQLEGIPTALKFTSNNFPHLRHLTLRFDRQRTMLPRLAKFDSLESLAISPNHDGAIFAALSPTCLTALVVGGGALQRLDGIERLQNLVQVGVNRMDKLESIEALARLPIVQEITIQYCAILAHYDALLHIPALEELAIIGCKRFDSAQYRSLFEALDLKKLTLLA